MKLSPVDHLVDGILVLVQKEVTSKKKVFVAQNLKPSLPLKTMKNENENKVCLSRQFYAPSKR
jgi:hypothetical protein